MPLVLDLRIAHDRVGSSVDPTLNGHLRYPNNLDRSLNEATNDKVRKYRADYNNNPPSVISFMTAISSTSGRLHCEFIRLLFLQSYRETDLFFFTVSEFRLRKQIVESSTAAARLFLPSSNVGLEMFSQTNGFSAMTGITHWIWAPMVMAKKVCQRLANQASSLR